MQPRRFVGLIMLSLAPFRLLALHVAPVVNVPRQTANRALTWLVTRYEHLLMRSICWLVTRNFLEHSLVERLVERIAAFTLRIVAGEVLSLEEARELTTALFDAGATVGVGTCPCRRARRIFSDRYPAETDMVFGRWARQYVANHPESYREITRDEALELLEEFDRSGLVRQVYGMNDAGGAAYVMCNCAEDACIPLLARRNIGVTAFEKGRSRALVDTSVCRGTAACGICIKRCQFAARVPVDGKAAVDEERCFGCGLCVSGCPAGASALRRVEGAELHYARDFVGH